MFIRRSATCSGKTVASPVISKSCFALRRPQRFAAVAAGASVQPTHVESEVFTGEGRKPQRVFFCPVLHGRLEGPGSGAQAAEVIHAQAPRQVLVELCAARYGETRTSIALNRDAQPPSRLDILGNIHGGLLSTEMVPVLAAARAVGAAVVPIDRSRRATRSRVAQNCWHPKTMQGLFRYGAYSLRQRALAHPRDSSVLLREFQSYCPQAYEVLVEERCKYMAHLVRAVLVPDANVVVVCSALHCDGLSRTLRPQPSSGITSLAALDGTDLVRLARRTVPVWPFYLFGYVLVPVGLFTWVAHSALTTFVIPSLSEAGLGSE